MLTPPRTHALGVTTAMSAASVVALAIVWAVAGITLCLWLFPSLAELAPSGWAQMSALTAEGVLLLAGSLTLAAPRTSRLAETTARIAAVVVILVGVVTFLDRFAIIRVSASSLPSTQTAAAFTLLGLTILVGRAKRFPPLAAEAVIGVYLAFLLFLVAGYVFNATDIVVADDGRLAAPQTLLCLIALGFVVVARLAIAGGGLFEIAVMNGLGSRILRYMVPVILTVPFVLFSLVNAMRDANVLPAGLLYAVFVPVIIICVLCLVGWMAHRINRLQHELVMQSTTDELTSILNRRGFLSVSQYVVKAAERSETSLIVMFFDLDGLKAVNDTHGHEAGSDLLQRFAALLTDTFRQSDIVARIGGDEFAVLTALHPEDVTEVSRRIEKAVEAANAGAAAKISYSVGFSLLKLWSDNALEEAMAVADAFMYRQKRRKEQAELLPSEVSAIVPLMPTDPVEGHA